MKLVIALCFLNLFVGDLFKYAVGDSGVTNYSVDGKVTDE
jgi:hypothetical protein